MSGNYRSDDWKLQPRCLAAAEWVAGRYRLDDWKIQAG